MDYQKMIIVGNATLHALRLHGPPSQCASTKSVSSDNHVHPRVCTGIRLVYVQRASWQFSSLLGTIQMDSAQRAWLPDQRTSWPRRGQSAAPRALSIHSRVCRYASRQQPWG